MKILVFDTETGGLEPSIHGITQVCAGVVEFTSGWEAYEVLDVYSASLKEIPGRRYEDEALKIQGRERADLSNGVGIGTAFKGVESLAIKHFGKAKAATPYGVNVKFDVDFMSDHAKAFSLPMPFNFVYRDICQWFRLLQDLGVHSNMRANLDTIVAHYGIPLDRSQKHDAVKDVEATAEAIHRMMCDFVRVGR